MIDVKSEVPQEGSSYNTCHRLHLQACSCGLPLKAGLWHIPFGFPQSLKLSLNIGAEGSAV